MLNTTYDKNTLPAYPDTSPAYSTRIGALHDGLIGSLFPSYLGGVARFCVVSVVTWAHRSNFLKKLFSVQLNIGDRHAFKKKKEKLNVLIHYLFVPCFKRRRMKNNKAVYTA